MRILTIFEHGTIKIGTGSDCISQKESLCLRSVWMMNGNQYDSVFDFKHKDYVKAKQYVGVAQIPGLTIEILPKVLGGTSGEDEGGVSEEDKKLAQANLLYMLQISKDLRFPEYDLADQRIVDMPLLEALIQIFVKNLKNQLRKGIEHEYVWMEDDLPYLRGKLNISQHIRKNHVHRERFSVRYEEFVSDTWLNRILKATCLKLLRASSSFAVSRDIQEILVHLSPVSDMQVKEHHFQKIHLTRNSKRFESLLQFCELVLFDKSPNFGTGQTHTFSLLFNMWELFERFVASFIQQNASAFRLQRRQIYPQSKGFQKYLLLEESSGNQKRFKLKPDLLIESSDCRKPKLILDTKWKPLDQKKSNQDVKTLDIYQKYSYLHRYNCPDNVILYPKVDGVARKAYRLDRENADKPDERRIRVEFLDMSYEFSRNKAKLIEDLSQILDLSACPKPVG